MDINTLGLAELYEIAGYSRKLKEQIALPIDLKDIIDTSGITSAYTCIFNWASMSYTFVSPSVKNILGYDKEVFFRKGFKFALTLIHHADLSRLREIHHAIFSYYYSVPLKERGKLRFSYNFRLQTADHFYVHILRQSTFTGFTTDGKPTFEFINVTDITGFKQDNDITLTVHRLSANGVYALCDEKKFPEKSKDLSSRERQVLELARRGHTTKEIAAKLYLSIETVKSHRKHIIAKTGAVNMTAATNMPLIFKE